MHKQGGGISRKERSLLKATTNSQMVSFLFVFKLTLVFFFVQAGKCYLQLWGEKIKTEKNLNRKT
jgi:hypothetical protein